MGLKLDRKLSFYFINESGVNFHGKVSMEGVFQGPSGGKEWSLGSQSKDTFMVRNVLKKQQVDGKKKKAKRC